MGMGVEMAEISDGLGAGSSFTAPLYQFSQSARLVDKRLPFKVVLLQEVPTSVIAVPVEDSMARDSWFLGMKWDLLFCTAGVEDGSSQGTHLGWRFRSVAEPG